MNDPLDIYNSKKSLSTYLSKEGLTATEMSIFEMLKFNKKIKILDLWCWCWRTTASLVHLWFDCVVWVDFAENLIAWAQRKYPKLSHKFIVGDATDLHEFSNESFDVVFFSFNVVFFSFNGIDYIPTRNLRLKAYCEIFRVLKPWGLYIFSSHNKLCFPINRLLLKNQLRNLFRFFGEYWYSKQSFGDMLTYYSTPKSLEKDLKAHWFTKLLTVPNKSFLFPFFDTFPYYIYTKLWWTWK